MHYSEIKIFCLLVQFMMKEARIKNRFSEILESTSTILDDYNECTFLLGGDFNCHVRMNRTNIDSILILSS